MKLHHAIPLLCIAATAAAQQPLAFLHPNDTIVFMGDSITDGGRQRTGSDYLHMDSY